MLAASSPRPARRSPSARPRRTSPEGLGGPRDDVEGAGAQHGVRSPLRDHGMDPPRPVRGDVGQRRSPLAAEIVEEPAQRLGGAVLPSPHQPAGVAVGDHQQVALPRTVGDELSGASSC